MEKQKKYDRRSVTEEELENLSGAFETMGPDTPWSRILDRTPDTWKKEWRSNLEKKYIPKLSEEDLEELESSFVVGGSAPWSTIVQNAPDAWREKWKRELRNRNKKQ